MFTHHIYFKITSRFYFTVLLSIKLANDFNLILTLPRNNSVALILRIAFLLIFEFSTELKCSIYNIKQRRKNNIKEISRI